MYTNIKLPHTHTIYFNTEEEGDEMWRDLFSSTRSPPLL